MKKHFILIAAAAALAGLWAGYAAGIAVFPGNGSSAAPSGSVDNAVLSPQIPEVHPAYSYDPGVTVDMDVLTGNWYPDSETAYKCLVYAKNSAQKLEAENVYDELDSAIVAEGSLSRYLKYRDTISINVDGTVYGAYVEDGMSPIGGGKGYDGIITTGDYIVRTYEELTEACSKAESGEVIFIPSDVTIDLSMKKRDQYYITLRDGVTLASDRGYVREDGSVSTGALIKGEGAGSTITTNFVICNSGSRLTGLDFRGPDPMRHVEHHTRCYRADGSFDHTIYYKLPMTVGIVVAGKNVEIDNCEISGFCNTAISVGSYDVHVHHNYIHHNQVKGLGYGIAFGHGGGIIEYNMFNWNRHSIAGSGPADSYYIARYNVDMGDSLDHVYDMHGGRDRGDGTNIAGKYIEMYNNTFLADNMPYHVRGVPVEYQKFYHNVVINPKTNYNFGSLTGKNIEIYDNIFGIEKKTVLK